MELARDLLEKAGGKIRLPVDHVVAAAFKEDAEHGRPCPSPRCPRDGWGSTSAPRPRWLSARRSRKAKIVLWNGPMGVFEMKPFAEGTLAVARALADCPGHDHRGRRRQRGRGHADGPGRQDRPRLHGRRRLPRVPGRRPAARRRLPAGGLITSVTFRTWSGPSTEGDTRCILTVPCPPEGPSSPATGRCTRRPAEAGGPRHRDPRRRRWRRRARRARGPALHRPPRGGGGPEGERGGPGRPEHALGERGRLHRRGLAGHAQGRGLLPRHPRPLRAPAALRRDRRRRGPEGGGGVPPRPHARSSAWARRWPSASRAAPWRSRSGRSERALRGLNGGPGRAPGRGLRAGLGHRHRPHRHPRPGPGGARVHPPARGPLARRGRRRRRSASSTGAASSPTTSPP